MTKPMIQHDPGCLPRSIDQTIEALAGSNVGLVRWADSLYQIRVLSEAQNGVVSRLSVAGRGNMRGWNLTRFGNSSNRWRRTPG